MGAANAEQVVIGKLSMLQAQGQISLFVLPQSFSWLEHFSAEEIARFFAELLDALGEGERDHDWSRVSDVIESWKATAEISADNALSTAVEQGLDELNDDEGPNWSELKKDLGL